MIIIFFRDPRLPLPGGRSPGSHILSINNSIIISRITLLSLSLSLSLSLLLLSLLLLSSGAMPPIFLFPGPKRTALEEIGAAAGESQLWARLDRKGSYNAAYIRIRPSPFLSSGNALNESRVPADADRMSPELRSRIMWKAGCLHMHVLGIVIANHVKGRMVI